MKKGWIRTTLWLSGLAAVLLALLAGAAWWKSCRTDIKVPALTAVLVPSHGISQGEDVTAVVQLALPWCRRIENIRTELPRGIVAVGKASQRRKTPRFDHSQVVLEQLLRPLRSGRIKEGKLIFEIRQRGRKPLAVTAVIPSFEVESGTGTPQLQLASAVKIPQKNYFWVIAAAVILLIAAGAGLYFYLKRPRKARELTEWELASREMEELKRRIASRELAPEKAFITLTELMRRYLERRFGLPVTRRTALEFLNIMETCGSRFPAESRPFLKAFLAEADLVKFAKAVPEEKMVERSAQSAEEFITRTRPESEVKNV